MKSVTNNLASVGFSTLDEAALLALSGEDQEAQAVSVAKMNFGEMSEVDLIALAGDDTPIEPGAKVEPIPLKPAILQDKYKGLSVIIVDDVTHVADQLREQLIAIGVDEAKILIFDSTAEVKEYARSFDVSENDYFVKKIQAQRTNLHHSYGELPVNVIVPERLVIFQDNDCPGQGDGIKLIRALNKIMPGHDVATIMYSGNNNLVSEPQWKGLDSEFMGKPWSMNKMETILDKAIAKSKKIRPESHGMVLA